MSRTPLGSGMANVDGTRIRTLDDVLQPSGDELRLVALIEMALIQATTPCSAEPETRRYLEQLQRTGVPADGLQDFRTRLLADPAGLGWRACLLEVFERVPATRRRVWLTMQSVWGVGDELVEGPAMRRMDAILDLDGFPLCVIDLQGVLNEYVGLIANAKVHPNADLALTAGGMAAVMIAAWHGLHVPSARVVQGIDYVRERIAKVDREVRTLSELVLAADVASLQEDGLSTVEDLARSLREDHDAAAIRLRRQRNQSMPGETTLSKRLDMITCARELVDAVRVATPIAPRV